MSTPSNGSRRSFSLNVQQDEHGVFHVEKSLNFFGLPAVYRTSRDFFSLVSTLEAALARSLIFTGDGSTSSEGSCIDALLAVRKERESVDLPSSLDEGFSPISPAGESLTVKEEAMSFITEANQSGSYADLGQQRVNDPEYLQRLMTSDGQGQQSLCRGD